MSDESSMTPPPTSGNNNSNSPAPSPSETSGGSGYSVSDFMKEAANIEAPNVTYEEASTNPDDRRPQEPGNEPSPEPQGPQPEEVLPPAHPNYIKSVQDQRHKANLRRKYDGLEAEEAPLFQQMSQAAYDKLYPMAIEYKELKSKQDQLTKDLETANSKRYYEEDGAWKLHPEVKQIETATENLSTEQAFWEEQLAAVEADKPWYILSKDKNGAYVYGEQRQPSPAAKAEILSQLTKTYTMRDKLADKLEVISSTFSAKHKTISDSIAQVDKAMFGTFPMDNPVLKSAYDANMAKFPSEYRGNIMAQMIAKADVVITNLVRLLNQRDASNLRTQAVKKVITSQGPGGGLTTGSGNSDSIQDLEARFRKAGARI